MQQLTKAAEKYALLEKQNQQLKTSSSGGAATAAAPVPTLPTAAVAAATVTTLNSPQLQELEKLKVEIEALRGQFESKDKELQDSRNKIQDLQAQLTSSSANATDTVNAGHAAVNGNLTAAAAAAVVATSAVANVDDREVRVASFNSHCQLPQCSMNCLYLSFSLSNHPIAADCSQGRSREEGERAFARH